MSLRDQVIDEAELLAKDRILYDPTDEQILDAIREITGVDFHSKSTCAMLAIAAYNRMERMRNNSYARLEEAWLVSR